MRRNLKTSELIYNIYQSLLAVYSRVPEIDSWICDKISIGIAEYIQENKIQIHQNIYFYYKEKDFLAVSVFGWTLEKGWVTIVSLFDFRSNNIVIEEHYDWNLKMWLDETSNKDRDSIRIVV